MPALIELPDWYLMRVTLMMLAATIAVVTDVRRRRIPNALTLPVAVTGFGIAVASGGLGGLVVAVVGSLTGGLLFLIPVARLGWGMGDLKLAVALGAVGGPLFAIWMGLYAMAAGGLFALIWLKKHGQLAQVVSGMQSDLHCGRPPLARSGLSIAYAVPLAVGVVMALFVSPGLAH